MTKRIENKGMLKRVLVVLLIASAMLVGAGSAAIVPSWTESTNYNANWYADSVAAGVFEIKSEADLAAFSYEVSVNTTPHSFAGETVYLMKNIDLDQYVWTPIGTETNPFSGVFDGNGHTISNMKVYATTANQGFFGYVANATLTNPIYGDISDIYDITNGYKATDAETKFQTKVGNFTLVNPYLESTNTEIGAAVGCAYLVYVHNINVGTSLSDGGSVEGQNSVGGVLGRGCGSIVDNCINYATITNTSTPASEPEKVYNAGGIAGSMRSKKTTPNSYPAIVNSINYGTVEFTLKGGGAGGICGQTDNGLVIYNCENYGNVLCDATNVATEAYSSSISGILGTTDGGNILAESKNAADIRNTGNNLMGSINGIYGRPNAQSWIIDCENTGNLAGKAKYMGGVTAFVSNAGAFPQLTVKDTIVSGTLTNDNTDGLTSTYVAACTYDATKGVLIDTVTFDNAEALKTALVQEGRLVLKNVNVLDTSGTVSLDTKAIRVIVEDAGCSLPETYKIDVSSTPATGVSLNMTVPNSVITITGTTSNSATIKLSGEILKVTNEANGDSVKIIIDNSENSQIINSGNIASLSVSNSDKVIITNSKDKTISEGLHVTTSNEATIYNDGIIKISNLHGLSLGSGGSAGSDNVVIHNKGEIYSGETGASYILYAPEFTKLTLLNYDGAKLKSRTGSYFITYGSTSVGHVDAFAFKDGIVDASDTSVDIATASFLLSAEGKSATIGRYNASNITGLVLVTPPTKTEYKAGDIFDPSGMKVNASYVKEDGTSEEIELDLRWLVYPTAPLTAGQTIEVTFLGIGTTIPVTVNVPATPSSSGSSSGSSVWLQEPATPTPTPTPTETATPTDAVPTDIPVTQPTATPASPGFGILAAFAGLGAVAVLRRK